MTGSPDPITRLLDIMRHLRDPDHGCPWDRAQTSASIARYTLEEAYEVVDAIDRGDSGALRDELGDLLLQVVFHARMAEEAGIFGFDDVAQAIAAKLVRRHPHIFRPDGSLRPSDAAAISAEEVRTTWEAIKSRERSGQGQAGPLAGIASTLPALVRAQKLSARAASHGFDWTDVKDVLAKVREEIDEVEEAIVAGEPKAVCEEIGDLLFSVVNLARHVDVDAEYSLKSGNSKFERRFTSMAAVVTADGTALAEADLAGMEAAWDLVKTREKDGA